MSMLSTMSMSLIRARSGEPSRPTARGKPARWVHPRTDRTAGASGDDGESGKPLLQDGAVRRTGLELAEDTDRAQRDPVDEQVGRRQVELAAELVRRRARAGQPGRLAADPGPGEPELVHGD